MGTFYPRGENMSSIYLKQLPEKFVNKYKRLVPPWGPVGLVTYKRTYSRQIEEGRTEDWHETVARCVNGALKIGLKMTDEEAFYLYDSVFNLRCTFSGRALWQLGTKTVERFGGDSLQNCWAVACDEPIEPFCFAFNELMLGGGVGFNVQREFVYEIPRVKFDVNVVRKDEKDVDYIVPDNREGWVDLLRRTFSAFFLTGKSFSYSTICVRPKGARINSFGGTASGPEDLCKGISEVVSVLKERAGKKLRPTDCLDIMNIIGSVVVAGNVRRCLPEGAMVHAKDGLIPIEKVKRGQLVLTRKGYKKVSNVFCQGIQKVIRIKTQDGHFDCTPNHKMCVMTAFNEFEWRIASELKPGDRIVSTRIAIDGGKTVLPAWSYDKPSNSTTCIDISIPDLDEDMAWFIGLFHADGYTYANRKENGFNAYVSVVLSENEFEMAVRARDQMSRFGTGNVVLKHSKEEKSWKVTCQSKQLAWYLDDNVKKPKTEIRVPEFILGGTKEIRLAYVCGVMDGDGCCHNKPIQVLTTVYREFANDVQNLLYSCGIESRLGESDDEWESKKGWQKQFHVRLITTRSKLSLAHAGQSEKEIRIGSKSQYANGYPSSWFEFGFHGKLRDLAASAVDQVNVDRLERVLGPQDFIPVEVLEVSDDVLRLAETFDIEVEDEHEFFCNGYLTHNSAQLALGDIDDSSYLDAKNWEKGSIPNWRSMSNNSVVCNKAEYMHDKFWDTYDGGSEPYGLINLSNCRKFGRIVDGAGYRPDPKIIGTNPCGEIPLESMEACNLAEIFLPNISDVEEFKKVAGSMYKVVKAISCLPFIHEGTNAVVQANHRLGISVTGFLQSGYVDKPEVFDSAYKHIEAMDEEYSKVLGCSRSIKLTTVKPSGTVSLLPGVTPGVHPAYSHHYIRRIRMASDDKLVDICRKHGYHVEPQIRMDGSRDMDTMVVSFPIHVPEGTVVAKDVSAAKQLDYAKFLQRHWSDNSVSVTVYYKKEELPEIKSWLAQNYDEHVKTVSFLLHSGHGFVQAPYEEISAEDYAKFMGVVAPITSINDEKSVGLKESLECAGGACPIK